MKIKQLTKDEILKNLGAGNIVYRLNHKTGYCSDLTKISIRTISQGFDCDDFVYFIVE